MSDIYIGDSTGDVVAAYTLPEDSDGPPRTADVNVPFEGIADDVARLNLRTRGGTIKRHFAGFIWNEASGTWILDTVNGCLQQASNSSIAPAVVPLKLPHGATIAQVEVHILPAGGHAGIPGTMPTFSLAEQNPATGVTNTLHSFPDPAASVGVYETQRSIVGVVPGSPVVDAGVKRYFMRVNGEAGANSLATPNLRIFAVSVQFTLAEIDKGAA